MSTIAERIKKLREEIRRHDYLYYVKAAPEISDRQYDELMQQLKDLEAQHPDLITPDSPTQRVSGQPIEGFTTVTHAVPMLSIDNTYSPEEVKQFDARVKKALGKREFHYIVDPKIDGVAVSLRYEDGKLALAATRGDGQRGDDITVNARAISSVPLGLHGSDWPNVLEVRGEVYWPRKAFAAYNAKRIEKGKEAFANPRNGAAGTLKQLDPKIVAERKLAFLTHGFGQMNNLPAKRAGELTNMLGEWGLPINPHTLVCKNIDEVLKAIDDWAEKRLEADYETDGMVVKVDELALRDELGATGKHPRWCIAYKYAAEQAATVLRTVDFQVGRLGTITPVAHFDTVQLAGTKVSNATLHNFDQVERLDVRVGDTVLVLKAGEIIPQVVQVVFDKRSKEAPKLVPPKKCPVCEQSVIKDEGGVYIRCVNPDCPAQIRERLIFFAGRDQMDIENLGPAIIDQLLSKGLVKHLTDLCSLKKDQLLELERMGEKSAQKLIEAIEESKSRGLTRVLAGLGIRHVGPRVAEVLAEHFGDIDAVVKASVEELTEINEIGPAIARSIHEFFHSKAGQEMVQRLKQAGIKLTEKKVAPKGDQPLAGKIVVVTGTLENFSRKEAEDAIKQAGGRVTSSVSSKTDFVVAGADPGENKVAAARKDGVEMIDEKEFIRRLGRK